MPAFNKCLTPPTLLQSVKINCPDVNENASDTRLLSRGCCECLVIIFVLAAELHRYSTSVFSRLGPSDPVLHRRRDLWSTRHYRRHEAGRVDGDRVGGETNPSDPVGLIGFENNREVSTTVRSGALTEGLDHWEHESAKLSLTENAYSATANGRNLRSLLRLGISPVVQPLCQT